MANAVAVVGAGSSANANADWVVFTGKLPQEIKRKLKVVAAQTGVKQQEIVADAVSKWMAEKGF